MPVGHGEERTCGAWYGGASRRRAELQEPGDSSVARCVSAGYGVKIISEPRIGAAETARMDIEFSPEYQHTQSFVFYTINVNTTYTPSHGILSPLTRDSNLSPSGTRRCRTGLLCCRPLARAFISGGCAAVWGKAQPHLQPAPKERSASR